MLAATIHWHSKVGVKSGLVQSCRSITEMLDLVLRPEHHIEYSERLERKTAWFEAYGGGKDVFTHMGAELINESPLDGDAKSRLDAVLTDGLAGNRLLVKSPSLSFKVKSIARTFPGARFVAILRRGEQVVASWGKRSYGFGQKVDWGPTQYQRLSMSRGISIFSRKWQETIDYLSSVKNDVDIRFVAYEQLLKSPSSVIQDILEFLDLPSEPYIHEISFSDRSDIWRNSIPLPYQLLLKHKVRQGNRTIEELTSGR